MRAAVFFHESNSCCRIWNIPLFGSFRRDRWLDFLHILPWNYWLIFLESYAVFRCRGILRMIGEVRVRRRVFAFAWFGCGLFISF